MASYGIGLACSGDRLTAGPISFPAPGVWSPPPRAHGGRPAKHGGDRFPALRARALDLCLAPAEAPTVAPFRPWCADDGKPCDRYGLILGYRCKGKCGRRSFRRLACKRADCPRCAVEVGKQRADRLWKRIGGAEQLGIVVLTFPKEWRPYLTPEALIEIEISFRARLLSWAETTFGGAIGGRSYWHPCGDRCSGCGAGRSGSGHNAGMGREGKCGKCGKVAEYKPHLNILIPSIAVLPNGSIRRLRMHLGPKQLAALHAIARAQLAELAAVIGEDADPFRTAERLIHVDGSYRAPRNANVYYAWRKEAPKIKHSIRYFGRPFPAWRNVIPHLGRDFGLLAGQDRKGERRRTDYRASCARMAVEKAAADLCPCCAGPLEPVGVLARAKSLAWQLGAIDLDAARATEQRSKERAS